jgi:hypothetical protein
MALIVGSATKDEIRKLRELGYEVIEHANAEMVKQTFGGNVRVPPNEKVCLILLSNLRLADMLSDGSILERNEGVIEESVIRSHKSRTGIASNKNLPRGSDKPDSGNSPKLRLTE